MYQFRAVWLLVLVLTVSSVVQGADERKNVLFLIADDLNCDLGCYGHRQVKTPNIDAIAARGVRFDRAYCQFPLCSPSRSSMLTGRRPNATGVLTNPGRSKEGVDGRTPHFRDTLPNAVTLPQYFRNQDYFVARVGKLYHYGVPLQIGTSGMDDPPSWDHFVNPRGRDRDDEPQIFSMTPGQFGGTVSWLAAEGADEDQTDGRGAAAAIDLLREHQKRPFFLAVGFYRPHTPYVAPKAYFDQYPTAGIELPKLSADDQSRVPAPAYASAKKDQDTMTDDQRRQAIQAYWASISFMDAQVGKVLKELSALGLDQNTVVVMTSDHGYHLADHGLWQKQSLFERSARVPLIIVEPGATGNGRATQSLAELIDLYPTLADSCGLPAPTEVDGISQRPVLYDPEKSVKAAALTQVQRGQQTPAYSVRTAQYRYTEWRGRDQTVKQLFDLQADPNETRNLANDPALAPIIAEHARQLESMVTP